MSKKTYTTEEAAKAVGITRQTLHAWINKGLVKPPKMQLMVQIGARLWSEADIARLKRVVRPKMGRPRKGKP
jgi:DNA-binding transcriptional MerR regulator